MTSLWTRFWHDDQGQDLVEYALMLTFLALTSAALYTSTVATVNAIWSGTNSELSTAASS
jgi:Flp pilus assembly pilin Flp